MLTMSAKYRVKLKLTAVIFMKLGRDAAKLGSNTNVVVLRVEVEGVVYNVNIFLAAAWQHYGRPFLYVGLQLC